LWKGLENACAENDLHFRLARGIDVQMQNENAYSCGLNGDNFTEGGDYEA
jgi:hypothetical protein